MPFKRRNLIKKSRLLLQRLSSGPKEQVKPHNTIPLIGIAIGLSAFCFQVAILYPWHHELSDQLTELKSCVLDLHTSNKALGATVELLKKDAEDMHKSTKDLHDSVDLLHDKVSNGEKKKKP